MNKDVVRKGKSLVMAIQGLQAMEVANVDVGEATRQSRLELKKLYQGQLREILASASSEETGEILSVMTTANLPLRDMGLN